MHERTLPRDVSAPLSTDPHLLRWVRKMGDLARPSAIHWVDVRSCAGDADAGNSARGRAA